MSLPAWGTDESIKTPCATERESWQCINMRPIGNDTDMNYEHYECKLCGRRVALDYDEMR